MIIFKNALGQCIKLFENPHNMLNMRGSIDLYNMSRQIIVSDNLYLVVFFMIGTVFNK